MKKGKTSKRLRRNRFRLLLYDRVMSRMRLPSLILAALSFGFWYGITSQRISWPSVDKANLLRSSGFFFLGYWLFTVLSPLLAYVRVLDNHLLLRTPIYRLRIPYQNILNTRLVEVQKLFQPSKLSASQHGLLRPFFGRTAVAIDLQGLSPPGIRLRLFFHRLIFSPDTLGLVLLVQDWLGLSHLLSIKLDEWRMIHSSHITRGASDAADILKQS
jgi:hypothetical protein